MHVCVVRYTCTTGSAARIRTPQELGHQNGTYFKPVLASRSSLFHGHLCARIRDTHTQSRKSTCWEGTRISQIYHYYRSYDSYPNNFTYAVSANLELWTSRISRGLNARYIGRIYTSHFSFLLVLIYFKKIKLVHFIAIHDYINNPERVITNFWSKNSTSKNFFSSN